MKKIWLSVGGLLLLFFVLGVSSMAQKSVTNDEVPHIAAGYSYIKTGDFRMNPEHPPLIKLLAGLPLLIVNPNLPLQDNSWAESLEWEFGARFLYTYNTNADQIVFWARIPMMLLATLFGLFVFLFARDLYGDKAGLMALLLYSLSPNVLASSRLVTTDMGIAGFAMMTFYFLWKYMEHGKRKDLILSGVLLGCCLSAKHTGLFMPGIMFVTVMAYLYFKKDKNISEVVKSKNTYRTIGSLCIMGLIGVGVLFASYGFVGFPAFIDGFKNVVLHSALGHRAYLMGEYSESGWWYYFPLAFLFKTPLGMIALLAICLLFLSRTKFKWRDEMFLIIPALLFFGSFMVNKVNIGLRHVLPLYPFMFIYVSKLTTINWKKNVKILVIGGLLVLYIIESMLIFPHYLAFFNMGIGGPDNGWKYLSDSNIDWGQDLKGLGLWLDEQKIDHIKLTYFGLDSKRYRGIDWEELKCGPSTGLMVASITRLNGFTEKEGLCLKWLKEQEPIANIGHSILIWDIQEEDIEGEHQNYCEAICKDKCATEDQKFFSGLYNRTCKCRCSA